MHMHMHKHKHMHMHMHMARALQPPTVLLALPSYHIQAHTLRLALPGCQLITPRPSRCC